MRVGSCVYQEGILVFLPSRAMTVTDRVDLYEAQTHRSDDFEFRVNPGGGLGF